MRNVAHERIYTIGRVLIARTCELQGLQSIDLQPLVYILSNIVKGRRHNC